MKNVIDTSCISLVTSCVWRTLKEERCKLLTPPWSGDGVSLSPGTGRGALGTCFRVLSNPYSVVCIVKYTPLGERHMRKTLRGKRLCISGERLHYADSMGVWSNEEEKKNGKYISCGWTVQVINPSPSHFDLILKAEGCHWGYWSSLVVIRLWL